MSGRIAVVHLVWGPLGPQPPRAFARAYTEHQAGIEHELVALLNGVPAAGSPERESLLGELGGLPRRTLELERPVQDLEAYFMAAERLEHDWLCFLNSYSEPLVDGWLGLLEQAATEPGVGAVAASGSWASHFSHVRYMLGLGGPYAKAYGERESVRRVFAPSAPGGGREEPGDAPSRGLRFRQRARAARLLARQITGFPPFPCPHLRTNGFLIERRRMLALRRGRLRDKTDAYALESGRRSITRQLQAQGLRTLLVGRDGVAREPEDWAAGNTFWQGAQENLLIADNQTRSYEQGSMEVRRLLAAHAWGACSHPSPPSDPQGAQSYGAQRG